jgi:hypothetical protein
VELDECIGIVEAMDRKAYTHILMSEDVVNIVLMGAATVSPEMAGCSRRLLLDGLPEPLTAAAPRPSPAVPRPTGLGNSG